MTLWHFVLLAFAYLVIGGLMTLPTIAFSMIIIGKSGWKECVGTAATLDYHYGLVRLVRHSMSAAYLVLLAFFLALRPEDPTSLFSGLWSLLWLGLSLIAGALSSASIAWSRLHPDGAMP